MAINAMVTGATGYTGRAVVRELGEQKVNVIAHVRPDSSRLEFWKEHFEEMGAEVDDSAWEINAMAKTLKRKHVDTLFFLIGTTKARVRQSEDDISYEAVDFGLLKMLLDACVLAEVDQRIIYLSAMGVRAGAHSAYYRARWKAEQAIGDSGLDYIIARPPMITGPDRDESRPMERVGGAMMNMAAGVFRLFGARRLSDRYRSTSSTELARSLVELSLDEDIETQIVEAEHLKS